MQIGVLVLPLFLVLLWCTVSLYWLLQFNGIPITNSADTVIDGQQILSVGLVAGLWSGATVDQLSRQTVFHPQQYSTLPAQHHQLSAHSPTQASCCKTVSTTANASLNYDELVSKSTAAKSKKLNQGGISTVDQGLQSNLTGEQEGIFCDRSHWRTDICVVKGSDVRVKAKSVLLLQSPSKDNHPPAVEKVKPYTRKWEKPVMENIDEVTIESVDHHRPSQLDHTNTVSTDIYEPCSINYSAPAIIFSTGGYSGNVYHDFNDGLIPLYITTHHLHGEVVFLILEFHGWWFKRYEPVLKWLSHYPIIDLSSNHSSIYCFKEVMVGLKIHNELSVDPRLSNDGVSTKDFRRMLQKAFIHHDRILSTDPVTTSEKSLQFGSTKKPRLVLIAREGSRSLTNQAEVIALAKRVGFQVKVITPTESTKLAHLFWILHSCDAMMGVHGAAMTHLLFMRPGTLFIQIIPLGTDYPALAYYGEPAMKLGLEYEEYKISTKESSLSEKYDKNDEVLTDPQAIASKDWASLKKYYLQGQSVKLSLRRFKPVLQKAFQKINLKLLKQS